MRRQHWKYLIALATLALLSYGATIGNTLCVDQWRDFYRIRESPETIRPMRVISTMMLKAAGDLIRGKAYVLYGINLLFHILNGTLLFFICRKIAGTNLAGFLLAAYFVCSGILSEAVFWPVLYPFFAFLLLLAFRLSMDRITIAAGIGILTCCVMASLFIEVGLLSPLVIFSALLFNVKESTRCKYRLLIIVAVSCISLFVVVSLSTPKIITSSTYSILGIHVIKKILTAWLIMFVSPVYQAARLSVGNTVISAVIAVTTMAAAGAAVKVKGAKLLTVKSASLVLLVTAIVAIFSGFKEGGLPIMASRYFYVPFAFFMILVAYSLTRIEYDRRNTAIIAVALILMNSPQIVHHEIQWHNRSQTNKALIGAVNRTISEGIDLRHVYIITDTTKYYKEIPPSQGYKVVNACFVQGMVRYESGGRFTGTVEILNKGQEIRGGGLLFYMDERSFQLQQ